MAKAFGWDLASYKTEPEKATVVLSYHSLGIPKSKVEMELTRVMNMATSYGWEQEKTESMKTQFLLTLIKIFEFEREVSVQIPT
jgi:hypothetical protein